MPVKYQCPKCGRRFADWGAEKLGYQCPHDDNCPPAAAGETIQLVRMGGGSGDDLLPAPTLRRKPKKEVVGTSSFEDEVPTDSEELEREGFDGEDAEEEDIDEEEDELEAGEEEAETTETETEEETEEEGEDDEEVDLDEEMGDEEAEEFEEEP